MAANEEENAIEQELKCAICLDTYRNPKYVGACHHTFCSECIESVIQTQARRGSFSCPTCRRSYPAPFGGAGDLQNDFRAVSMIRALRSAQNQQQQQPRSLQEVAGVPTCRVCRVFRASSYCEQCGGGIHLCNRCSGKHAQTEATAHHKIFPIHEVCGPHEEPLKLYCQTCSRRLCHVCLLAEHSEHEVKDRSALLETTKQQVEKSYADSVWLKTLLENAGKEMGALELYVAEAVRRERETREQKSRNLRTSIVDIENEILRLERRRQLLRQELRSEESAGSEWDWAANQLVALKDDIKSVSTDLDTVLEKALGLKGTDLTTVNGEEQLLGVAKGFEKHLNLARRTTQAAADIKDNLFKVVTKPASPTVSATPDGPGLCGEEIVCGGTASPPDARGGLHYI